MTASILHLDGDDFFASIVRLKNPELRRRPLIIGHLHSRGATVATSRDIRKQGISPGIGMTQAKQLCPEATLIQIDWSLVHKFSMRLKHLVSRFSPLIEIAGPDSVFIDYSGCERLFGPAADFAIKLQKAVENGLGISFSAGLSANKAVSVVACRAAKLGRLESVKAGFESSFLSACPISWLPALQTRHVSFFSNLGLHTIGELAQVPLETLEHLLGKHGKTIGLQARGQEHSRVQCSYPKNTPFSQMEFPEDTLSIETIICRLASLSSNLCRKMRQKQLSAKQIRLSIKYSDRRLDSLQRTLNLPSSRDHEIFDVSKKLFLKLYQRRVRIRGITISAPCVTGIVPEIPFGDAEYRSKWDRVLSYMDTAHHTVKPNIVQLGVSLEPITYQGTPKRIERPRICHN
jgi:DNA polymerase IV